MAIGALLEAIVMRVHMRQVGEGCVREELGLNIRGSLRESRAGRLVKAAR